MLDRICTIYPDIESKEPRHLSVSDALERIRNGEKSGKKVASVRNAKTKEEANAIKKTLPCICFSGKFLGQRKDSEIKDHTNLMILDFDDVEDCLSMKKSLFDLDYVVSTWVSPSAKGVKALVLIADSTRHREHFAALKDIHPEIDKSGVNEARVCYESHDPDILIKNSALPFTKYKIVTHHRQEGKAPNNNEVFENLVKWMSNKRDAFVEGNRNLFIFKLASACCRFGLSQSDCESNIIFSFTTGSDFSNEEVNRTIRSAYNSNRSKASTASFNQDGRLVEKSTTKEIEIDTAVYDLELRPRDVVFGEDVFEDAMDIFDNGYPKATPLFMGSMDRYFKWKKGEITCLTGIGNMGKSSLLKQLLLLQVICEGSRIGIFAPEDFPAQEYYHELCEMYIGLPCVPTSAMRPPRDLFKAVYEYISQHFFFVYPTDIAPTSSVIKERFLELKIKRKIDFCVIDPFNQMADEGDDNIDKYLKHTLADLQRFARDNDVNFVIIAHPNGTGLRKNDIGDFVRPDVNNIAGGPMWNNKMDNILVYHRPFSKTEPDNPACEFESLKIRRQKVVGKKGICHFDRDSLTQRYVVDGTDWIEYHKKRMSEATAQVGKDLIDTESGEVLDASTPMFTELKETAITGEGEEAPF